MNAATRVFLLPELLELILLSLPSETAHAKLASLRLIYTSRTTTRTWHQLIDKSTPLRHWLHLPTWTDPEKAQIWYKKTAFPPAEPNLWIPWLLMNQRNFGNAWPFAASTSALYDEIAPSRPRYWTFSLELSRAQFSRLPKACAWRSMLATTPPFTYFWYTRMFYELGSGRAPFVTHADYDAKQPKHRQRFAGHREEGVTLGDVVDAMTELFVSYPSAKFVLLESVRVKPGSDQAEASLEKMHYLSSSAEKVHS